VIDHRGAVNTLLDINRRFAVGARDRVLAISSLSFDLSVYDFFGMLAAGAAVVLLEPQQALDPAHWLALIERHQVSLWNSVPALFSMLLEYAEGERSALPSSLRVAMLSGEDSPDATRTRLGVAADVAADQPGRGDRGVHLVDTVSAATGRSPLAQHSLRQTSGS
ncbi:non-ribosomal peptide synthetase, partial [Pseudomonas savastanoi pv. glycinea str. race 4]